jgi:hypothetical protein
MSDLDYLLSEIAESLQLDPTQYDRMHESYDAVCRWLSAPESPVGDYRPTMYAQGSTAIGTTVKPKRDDEFDLDFVLQVEGWNGSPMALYNAVYSRLNAHGAYSPKLKPMRRCVRIEYAGQFHLDIVPATLIASPTPTNILITDSTTQSWTSSNPKGFARWFLNQARTSMMKAERKIEPLPKPLSVEEKEVLALAVQLMKRRRDELFANEQNEDSIPRSIVLTTLAGMYYQREESAAEALRNICMRIETAIAAAHPFQISVPNPTDANESFCESFDKAADGYRNFQMFIRTLRTDMDELLAARPGLDAIPKKLAKMFGETPTGRAVGMLTERIAKLRGAGALRTSASGLAIVSSTTKGTTVPANRFYGN